MDDLIGWDCAGYSGLQDNIPSPPSGVSNGGTWAHGTHVAGLLSATSNNNTGIASIGFNCSIMSVKVSTGEQSYPYITHGYDGILYAARAGYHNDNFTIINNSWGGIGYNQYEQAVIDVVHNDYGAVVVAAAGNGDEWDLGTDEFAHYPSSYEHVMNPDYDTQDSAHNQGINDISLSIKRLSRKYRYNFCQHTEFRQ